MTTPFRCLARPSPRQPTSKNLVLGIRPENFELNENPESNDGIPIDIGVVEELGRRCVHLRHLDWYRRGRVDHRSADRGPNPRRPAAAAPGRERPFADRPDARPRFLQGERRPHLSCNGKRLHRLIRTAGLPQIAREAGSLLRLPHADGRLHVDDRIGPCPDSSRRGPTAS